MVFVTTTWVDAIILLFADTMVEIVVRIRANQARTRFILNAVTTVTLAGILQVTTATATCPLTALALMLAKAKTQVIEIQNVVRMKLNTV
jgi:hypothetical protein